jgi:hypothetical protein
MTRMKFIAKLVLSGLCVWLLFECVSCSMLQQPASRFPAVTPQQQASHDAMRLQLAKQQ